MSTRDDAKPRKFTGAQLWKFLNSSFGLFILSSVVLSFVTWMYTGVSQAREQRIVNAENATKLDTEISYRIQLLDNYFESDCAEHSSLSRDTFVDIRDIYKAGPDFQAIFPENRQKDLHTLIWEKAALLEAGEKAVYVQSFNELTTRFNAFLTRFLRQTQRGGGFYSDGNEPDNDDNTPDFRKPVNELIQMFSTAIRPIRDEVSTLSATQTTGDSERADADTSAADVGAD